MLSLHAAVWLWYAINCYCDTGMHELVGTCLNWFGGIKETDNEEVVTLCDFLQHRQMFSSNRVVEIVSMWQSVMFSIYAVLISILSQVQAQPLRSQVLAVLQLEY